MENIHST